MAEEQLTTIQIPVPAREMLRKVAEYYRRSMSGQVTWMVENELREIEALQAQDGPAPAASAAQETA